MKFECGKKRRLKREAQRKWHKWFAWRPIKLAKEDCRWFERIERRKANIPYSYPYEERWEYRACRPVEKGSQ